MKTIDQFAAHALQGLMASGDHNCLTLEETAILAYNFAEAMMDERDLRVAERVKHDTGKVS